MPKLTEDILLGLDEAVVVATAKGVSEIRVPVAVLHELVVAARETLGHREFMDGATREEKADVGLAMVVASWGYLDDPRQVLVEEGDDAP